MSRILYNEGRVCGMSAYEAYVKNALAEDPNTEPVSEREWLASTLAMGSSMLLKIDPFTPEKEDNIVKDYKLPDESSLIAPSTIIASFFAANPSDFSGIYDDTGWVTQVGSYGDLLVNNSTEPKNGGTYSWTSDSMNDDEKKRLLNYMRIQDGLVLQDGTWETRTASNNPKRILKQPNFKNSPTVRIRFAREVTTSFFVLLTGFVTWGVVIGESGFGGGAAGTANPYNGDFLGPAVFPWANKIMFHTSASMAYQSQTSIQAGGDNVEIVTDPDSFDTYIKVKNEIISKSEPYLVVVQTEDGGHTEITLDTDALLSLTDDHLKSSLIDLVHPGSGINIDSVSNGVNVRTYLEAASGIKIYTGSDSNPGEQTTTHQSTKVAANIQPGAGISIDNGSGTALIITNAAVSGTYTYFQSWGTINDGSSYYSPYNDYWIRWYNNFFAGDEEEFSTHAPTARSVDSTKGYHTLLMSICPSKSGDDITSASVKFNINNDYYRMTRYGNFRNTSAGDNFLFAHSNTIFDRPESRICTVLFPSDSEYVYLSKGDIKQFTDTSDYLTGVWNTNVGGCNWPVRVAIVSHWGMDTNGDGTTLVVKDSSGNPIGYSQYDGYRAYTLYAVSIADGYNWQYSNDGAYSVSTINAGLLNLDASFNVTFNT